mmetsp:Transcript_16164/g.18439  ORF Transcript_16164/g.18439 Transcript_16164/m.18439 type:complete len:343 (+) Transcript_16164:38-1066(+)
MNYHQNVDDPNHTGRTILTALYLCMLSVCFVVPVFFYFRMHCDDRQNRRLRDLEIEGIQNAMNESQDLHQEESRAARKKYLEERRARIIQLFTPVRMILTEDNFISSETDSLECVIQKKTSDKMAVPNGETWVEIQDDIESTIDTAVLEAPNPPPSSSSDISVGEGYDEFDVNDSFILVPKPGLPDGASIYEFNSNIIAANKNQDTNDLRKVPNECSICLCEYTVGSDTVWSSNPQCFHVFHADCIEQWLMKQRDGPLCPCCRRDFVIDPFDDVGPGENDDVESGNDHSAADGDIIIVSSVQSVIMQQQPQQESMSRIIDESSDGSSDVPEQTRTDHSDSSQ